MNPNYCARVLLFIALIAAGTIFSSAAKADEYGYIIVPQNIRSSFQLSYTDNVPEFSRVKTPSGKFSSAYGEFRFDPDTATLSRLRIAVSAGSLTTPDKSFTWKLLGPDVFDINNYEDIVLESVDTAAFKDGTTTMNGRLTMRGHAKPCQFTVRLNYIKDSAIGFGLLGKNKIIGLTLQGTVNQSDYHMGTMDSIGRSLGTQIILHFDLQGFRQ